MKHYVVIPCYNEERRLNIQAFSSFLTEYQNYFLVFVNDGSTDNTKQLCQEIMHAHPNNVQCISLSKNMGKATAVAHGIKQVLSSTNKAQSLGFLDADLSTPLQEYANLVYSARGNEIKFTMAKRVLYQKNIKYSKGRVIGRLGINFLIKHLYKLNYEDTQCGAKVFSIDVARKIFNESFTSTWLFDIELILRFKQYFPQDDIMEYNLLHWTQADGSKMKLKHKLLMPIVIFRIYTKYI